MNFRPCLYLVTRGVPYNKAFRMPAAKRLAHYIVLHEMGDGMRSPIKYDWDLNTWSKVT